MLDKNTLYGQLSGDIIIFAPSMLRTSDGALIGTPDTQTYLKYGWKKIIDQPEASTSAYWWKKTGYEESLSAISAVYEKVIIEPKPRHWTPLTIKRACEIAGYWQALHQMLIDSDVLEDFWGCQFIAEDDQMYLAVYGVACEKLGKATVDALIDQIPTEAY